MEEISLRDIINVIIKGKWLIALITIICLLLTGLGSLYLDNNTQTAKIYISFSFDGIGSGLNPDGTRFDSNKIMEPVVVQKALDSLQIYSTVIRVDNVRRNMSVVPVVPNDIVEKTEILRKEGQDFTYYPNEFVINLKLSDGIDSSTGGRILDAVVESYTNYFNDLYSDRSVLANAIGQLNYDEYDYPEVSSVIHNQINIISSYLSSKAKESNGFRSKQTGLTFGDIQESLAIIDNVDVSSMDSIIGAFNITKDKDKLITTYEYRIKVNELNKVKKIDEASQSKEMMNNYKREQQSILIPGLTTGENSSILQQENNSYYDSLADRATKAGVEASNRTHDNEYLLKEIERLKADTISAEAKMQAEKDVLNLLNNVKEKIENWIELTNKSVEEYYIQKLNKAIMRLSPIEVRSDVNILLNMLISLLIGLMIGILIAYFKDYWRSTSANKDI